MTTASPSGPRSGPDPGSGSGPEPEDRPVGPESALPSVAARVGAFVAIIVGGGAGALIGHSFAVLNCDDGSCELSRGLFLWIGAVIGALGVSVIAVLTLRALGEWGSIRTRDADRDADQDAT